AARAADLEDLAGVLRRDEREEEATGGRDDRARAELARDAALTLLGVLPLEALQHRAHPFVEHAASLRDEQRQTPGLSLVLARRRFRPRACPPRRRLGPDRRSPARRREASARG